jgi:hypothetical protein
MDQLIIKKKTGFKNLFPTRPIVIRDFRGVLFYSTEGLHPVEYFNLPVGDYFVDAGYFKELPKPIKHKPTPLPRAERVMSAPYDFNIKFEFNPYKCTIDWQKKTITFDDSFKSKPLPEIYFVLFHEFGHQIYNTEKYADLYAANMMRERGYNDTQIGSASIYGLSDQQYTRKNFLINQLIK